MTSRTTCFIFFIVICCIAWKFLAISRNVFSNKIKLRTTDGNVQGSQKIVLSASEYETNFTKFKFSPRNVPIPISRFDYPWFTLPRFKNPELHETRGRILFSPNPLLFADGIGHACSSNHADLSTAWRLGLTYTHRTSHYGSLSDQHDEKRAGSKNYFASYHNPAAVEDFLGWGTHEVPREAALRSLCPLKWKLIGEKECIDCFRIGKQERRENITGFSQDGVALRIDHVVEIPLNLSYNWIPDNINLEKYRTQFLYENNKTFTAFVMPTEVCDTYPLYLGFTEKSYSFYFNKYWDAHQTKGLKRAQGDVLLEKRNTFQEFYETYTYGLHIRDSFQRPVLNRLKESEIVIAIHARRGDFFVVDRPMVSLKVFLVVLRQLLSIIRSAQDGLFSKMNVSVAIYSEGLAKTNASLSYVMEGARKHDISKMRREFIDTDGSVISRRRLKSQFSKILKGHGNISLKHVNFHFRISEPTILCLHEMIAADIFIGSESGMSQQMVSSRSRAAFQFLPEVMEAASDRQIRFNSSSGYISPGELRRANALWDAFTKFNAESTNRAMQRK